MPLPTPDERPGFYSRLFIIPADLSPYLSGILLELARVNAWEQVGDRTPEFCASAFMDLYERWDSALIGSIFPCIGSLPYGCLWCEGQSVLIADYPRLASVIDPSFIVADAIILPDLRGRFLYGSGAIGDTGGEAEHTLTVDEMPAHDHGEHTHLPGQFSGTEPTQLPDFPIPDLFGSRGGGLPHNNLPPYFTVRFYIVAQ